MTTLGARLDRAAWAALSQDRSGVWSWPRAIVTIVGAMVCAVIIYVAVYPEPAFIAVLALVYVFLVYRARTSERRYGPGGVPR
jgi:Flp pilus assembly protein TadB